MEWRDIDQPPKGPVIIYVPGRGAIMARFSRYWNRWLHWPYSDSISDRQLNSRAFGQRDIDPINNRKVHVAKMRKKLRPYGIDIERIRAFWCAGYESGGYFLTIQ
jgi:hypothetical protein